MSIALEMQEGIAVLAGPRSFHDTRESWLARAATKAGISFRQAKAFFYAETGDPRSQAVERVRTAVKREQNRVARNGNDDLASVLALAEACLADLAEAGFGDETYKARHALARVREMVARP